MTKKSTAAVTDTSSSNKPHAAKTPIAKPSNPAAAIPEEGAPIEKFRGERTQLPEVTGDEGSLDEETLDRDAPFNRTYGRQAD